MIKDQPLGNHCLASKPPACPCPHPATVIADYEMLSLSCILLHGKNFNVFVFVIRGPGLWDRPASA